MRLAMPLLILAGLAALALPGRVAAKKRTFTYRFTRRGTYRLFCSLHPALMTQLVIVP
jgi:plastocyanin